MRTFSFSRPLSRPQLKFIAILAMTLNHFAEIFLTEGSLPYYILTSIGYLTAVMMCCFLVDGFFGTRSRKKYFLRLLIFGLLSQPVYDLAFARTLQHYIQFNILLTLALCLAMLAVLERTCSSPSSGLELLILFVAAALSCRFDWGILLPLFTFLFLSARRGRLLLPKAFGCAWLLFGLYELFEYIAICSESPVQYDPGRFFSSVTTVSSDPAVSSGIRAAALLLFVFKGLLFAFLRSLAIPAAGWLVCRCYDPAKKPAEILTQKNRRREFWKWFFYFYYPLHLLVLYLLHQYFCR